jgi:WD40 repeat protein
MPAPRPGLSALSAAILAAGACGLAPAAAPPAGPGADVLPAGAVRRIGTLRLRQSGSVVGLAFAPDGKAVAALDQAGRVGLWARRSGDLLWLLSTGQQPGHQAIAFAPDGKTVATGGATGVDFWDASTAKMARRLAPRPGDPGSAVYALAFSPNGRAVVGGCFDHTVRLWDLPSGKQRKPSLGHTGPVQCVAFGPDGRTVASGGLDRTVRLWDLGSGRSRVLGRHPAEVGSVAFGSGGLLVSCGGGVVMLWDAPNGRALDRWDDKRGAPYTAAFSPGGKVLATGHADGRICLWDAATRRLLRQLGGRGLGVSALAFSPDGQVLASGDGGSTVRLWDVAKGRELFPSAGHPGRVTALAYSADGRVLFSGCQDGAVRVWQAGRLLRWFGRQDGGVQQLAVSPSGHAVATGGFGPTVRVWSASTGKQLQAFGGHANLYDLAFAHGGRLLVTASDAGLLVWDVARGEPITVWGAPRSRTLAVHSHPPSARLGCLTERLVYHSWAQARGRLTADGVRDLFPFRDQKLPAFPWTEAVIGPDGRTAALRGSGEVWALRLESGPPKRLLRGRRFMPCSLSLTPSGRLLAVGCDDGRGLLAESATGELVAELKGHRGAVDSLAFAPCGRFLASGGADTTVLIWDLQRVGDPRPAASDEQRERLWADLASKDAAAAWRAIAALASSPNTAFLSGKLTPAEPTRKRIERLVGELDHDDFRTRERAQAELAKLGEAAAPALRRALDGRPSAELKRRAAALLKPLDVPAQRVGRDRVLELLERLGTPEARKLLRQLAEGAPTDWQRLEATEALQRIARRTAAKP